MLMFVIISFCKGRVARTHGKQSSGYFDILSIGLYLVEILI